MNIDDLEKMFQNFRILGSGGVKIAGSIGKGYAVNCNCGEPPDEGAGPSPTPPITTGACCIGGSCSILTATDCATAGGIYQGDGTVCDPNPCFISTCPYNMGISGVLSGELRAVIECGGTEDMFSIASTIPETVCPGTLTPPEEISCSCCSSFVSVSYACPNGCEGCTDNCEEERFVQICASLTLVEGDWFLGISAFFNNNNGFCGQTCSVGGEPIAELNIGSDPVGTHNLVFNDPDCSTVNWDITVVISLP